MRYGRWQDENDELVELIRSWDRLSFDFQYDNHPDGISLDRYVHGALLSTSDSAINEAKDAKDVEAWLDGQQGWSASSVSLHVLSCAKCRVEVAKLREAYEADHVHQTMGWWKQIRENPRRLWSLGTLRRSAIAIVFVMLLVGGLFVVEDSVFNLGSDNGGSIIESHIGGITLPEDSSDAAVARLF